MPEPTPTPAPAPQGTPAAGTPAPAAPTPAPAAAPPANGGPPPLLAGTPPPVEPAPVKTVWGDDWREQYAGTDDKRLGLLKRYSSPKDILDAHFALKQKVDSGELKSAKVLPPNANSQEIAQYRKDNGIPENAGDYLVNLPNGLVIGEADKPALTNFAEAMHKANIPPAVVHQAIGWYNQWQEQQAAEVAKADAELQEKTADSLRAEWGKDFKTNINIGKDFLINTAGQEFADDIMQAVLPDGSRIGDNKQALQWLARTAREVNPVPTLVPGSSGDAGATVDSEIARIETFMRTNRGAYNRDTAMQDQLLKLYDARDRLKARKAG